jgi:16S rRNA (guanine527-N7)-methyltransferase
MSLAQRLALGIASLGLDLNVETQKKLLEYLKLLQKWNKVYNLTAIRDAEQMVIHHLLDSLSVLPHLWPGNWLDVGCGAGLPGLVLAIARPDWQFTLLDSNSKKTSFVQQVAIELGLQNLKVINIRVEELKINEKFDGIISRAFAETGDFVQLTQHLLEDKGRWAAMKGAPEQELQRLPGDIVVERIIPLSVSGLDAARCLVILKVK